MSIADKLKTVAQKMEDVYRTGLFKYAPKSTASGESILLENSAPEPFVSMKSYGREIKVLGGNCFNINNAIPQDNGVWVQDNGFAMSNYYNGVWTTLGALCPELRDGDEVYLNFEVENAGPTQEFYLYGSGRDWINGTSLVITQADLNDAFSIYGIDGETTVYKNIIVSKEPIPFEPYKTPKTLTIPQLNEGEYVDFGKGIIVTNNGNMPLTDEQIYAFKRLRANSPTTTIIGQGQLDVTYIVDNRQ